jgi:hypothetical protein
MKPTEEEIFVQSFVTELYNIKNKSLQNLSFYKSMYPKDRYTLKLKDYLSEKALNDFTDKNLYYNYIISSYNNGFDSSVYYINVKTTKKFIGGTTYSYSATVELFYRENSKREIYEVVGEVTVSKTHNEHIITKVHNTKFPSTGSSNVVSNLV